MPIHKRLKQYPTQDTQPPFSKRGGSEHLQRLAQHFGAQAQPGPEFPTGADRVAPSGLGRRELMQLLGASMALAGVASCTQRPQEKILPYVTRPPEATPGMPIEYATSFVLDGFALGVLAQSHEGRPIKIEGNPQHPASLGATDVFAQASVLDLYDPVRLRAPKRRAGLALRWSSVLQEFRERSPKGGAPWFVLYPQSSPTLSALIDRVRERFPGARFTFDSPIARTATYAASRALFGRVLETQYRFERAEVVLAIDADFMADMPMSVRWARDYAERRRPFGPKSAMSRLYAAETMPSPTGSLADHRITPTKSEFLRFTSSLLAELAARGMKNGFPPGLLRRLPKVENPLHARFVVAVAEDLARARGQSIVLAGPQQPTEVHLLVHALNLTLGNFGQTMALTESALLEPEGGPSLVELSEALEDNAVNQVVVLGANPVYTAPPELELGKLLRKVPDSVHLTGFENHTSRACRTILPRTHYLETWADARAYDGTISYVQPLIKPLYQAKSTLEILSAFAGEPALSSHALVKRYWQERLGASFEQQWEARIQLGLASDSGFAAVTPRPDWRNAAALLARAAAASEARPDNSAALELNLEPSPSLYDGRFANNAWLLELPHPMTKQAWGNAAIVAPETALALGIETGRVIEMKRKGRTLRAPVLVLPGHAEGAVTLELGYGQTETDLLGRDVGSNAYRLAAPSIERRPGKVAVRVTKEQERVALTQEHWVPVSDANPRETTLADYRSISKKELNKPHHLPSLLPDYPQRAEQWAMTIDTTICTGCSSCVIACQAENNVPVVGKVGVLKSREMHWLRIDRYFTGPPDMPRVVHQPMLCQHCEKAPCEYVCPVNATVHSPDGLNEMVYNRCIGTRFCSNNCPYKVRRFNWFEYMEGDTTVRMQRNPDVTVRERGVMEKCTYCVQRIRRAEMRARIEERPIEPGEVVPACAQACPTGAIQFGSLNQPTTRMVVWRHDRRSYAVHEDLGTRPRTRYLAKVTNLKPELAR